MAQVAVGHVHDEERAHHLRARSGLQDLQGRAQHVAGGVAGARDEAVRFAGDFVHDAMIVSSKQPQFRERGVSYEPLLGKVTALLA